MSRKHLAKRSLTVNGHRTSIALEPDFWRALERLAAARGSSLSAFVAAQDSARDPAIPLASVLRLAALRSAQG
jgi:predicted DNA-binding ribbon-helix-helix protein